MDLALTSGAIAAPRTEQAGKAALAPALLILVAALLGFTLVRHGTDYVANSEPRLVLHWAGAIAALCLLFLPAGYTALPRFAARCLRASGVFLIVYFGVEPFAIPYAAMDADHPAVQFHSHARWIGLALAFAGMWRPGFLFGGAMTLWMMRELQTGLTGFYFSTLDIRNVAEIIAFWSIGYCGLTIAGNVQALREAIGLDDKAKEQAAIMLFAAGIGAHLANYFWSGLAKLALDGGPLSWILGNRLYDGIPVALEKGTFPLAALPAGAELLDKSLRLLALPVNLAAFTVQIAAIVAPLRKRWLTASIVCFDIFHLAVWFTLGLLFWKWIALNSILLFALAAIHRDDWSRLARTTAIVFVIAGVGTFRTATLAWYETPGIASPYFVAEMKDGRRLRIPSAYFLSSSYQVSQGRIWWPGGTGHFHPSIWGSVLNDADLQAGRNCRPPVTANSPEPLPGPPHALGRFIQAQHRQMLERLDRSGTFNYYLVPHHHVPSPGIADPFLAADKRAIAKYYFVVESVCLALGNGRLKRDVLHRTAVPVYDALSDRIIE